MPITAMWDQRVKQGRPVWQCGGYTIQWLIPRRSWTLYDPEQKKHYHGLPSIGSAMERAEELWSRVEKIGLVSCCKEKMELRTVAERLYSSDLFQKAAAYCRANY